MPPPFSAQFTNGNGSGRGENYYKEDKQYSIHGKPYSSRIHG